MSNSSSIDIGILVEILNDHLDQEKKQKILKDINQAIQEEEQEKEKEKEKAPKIEKKGIIILTNLPEGITPKMVEDFCGYITEIPLENPTRELVQGLANVKSAYNDSKKAKKNPADNLADLFDFAPTKLFKEEMILKKPKGPLEFIYIPNR